MIIPDSSKNTRLLVSPLCVDICNLLKFLINCTATLEITNNQSEIYFQYDKIRFRRNFPVLMVTQHSVAVNDNHFPILVYFPRKQFGKMQKLIKTNITKAKTKNQPKISIKCAIPPQIPVGISSQGGGRSHIKKGKYLKSPLAIYIINRLQNLMKTD